MYNRKVLISAVQNRPSLWHHSNKDYKNRSKTSKEWEEVGKLCGINNGADAKKRWKNLKNQYTKKINKIPQHELNSKTATDKWPYFELLSFLNDVLLPTSSEDSQQSLSKQSYNQTDNRNMMVCTKIDSASTAKANTDCNSQATLPSSTYQKPKNINRLCVQFEQKKTQTLENENTTFQNNSQLELENSDLQFFKSLLPYVTSLPPIEKLQLRNLIQQAVLQYYQQWQQEQDQQDSVSIKSIKQEQLSD